MLSQGTIQEWKDQYVDYFGLKRKLDVVVAKKEAAARSNDRESEEKEGDHEAPLLVALRPLASDGDLGREISLRSLGDWKLVGMRTASVRDGLGCDADLEFYEALDADVARVEHFYLTTLAALDARTVRVRDILAGRAAARDDVVSRRRSRYPDDRQTDIRGGTDARERREKRLPGRRPGARAGRRARRSKAVVGDIASRRRARPATGSERTPSFPPGTAPRVASARAAADPEGIGESRRTAASGGPYGRS